MGEGVNWGVALGVSYGVELEGFGPSLGYGEWVWFRREVSGVAQGWL